MASPALSGAARRRYLTLVRGQARGAWPAAARLALHALSLPYGLAARLRNLAYDRGWLRTERAPVPVVSVGNLTTGGTGKTPCVEHVAGFYRALDLRVAVLSRGYGAQAGVNDEALVLEDNLPDVPHLQGPDRAALARVAALELESEVLVLDDGFQHRRLARDLDLVLLDSTDPFGGGHLLPRGLLREHPRGLRRAGLVLLTRCDQASPAEVDRLAERVARLAPGVPVARTRHEPVELVNADGETAPLDLLRGQRVLGFAGIGNPGAFRRTLEDLGASVEDFRAFADHHPYTRADVEGLHAWGRAHPAEGLLLTTQKDLVKVRLTRLGGRDLWAVRVRLAFQTGQDVLGRMLRAVAAPR